MMNYCKYLALLAILLPSFAAFAYDPFEVKVRTTYPKTMTTVRDAVEFIIEPFDYQLITGTRHTSGASSIANMPITPLARTTRTMAVYDAIQALIGPNNTILIDHENKLLSFREGK